MTLPPLEKFILPNITYKLPLGQYASLSSVLAREAEIVRRLKKWRQWMDGDAGSIANEWLIDDYVSLLSDPEAKR